MIKQADLAKFVRLTREACYDYTKKVQYRNLGRKILKALAEQLKLQAGDFDIRFNAGGQAVSGDHTLHADHVYVALHDNLGSGWFYYRTCKSRKDYSGGQNRIVYWNQLLATGIEGLAQAIERDCPKHPVIHPTNPFPIINTSVNA
jgi:hypothetical protein